MSIKPTINCTLIIRSQAEYSETSQTISVRYMLETPDTGQHCGFVDLEALICALRIELAETHSRIIPTERREAKS